VKSKCGIPVMDLKFYISEVKHPTTNFSCDGIIHYNIAPPPSDKNLIQEIIQQKVERTADNANSGESLEYSSC